MLVIYFIISFLATLFGSMVGIGGGVVIKPALDFLGDFDINSISLLSSGTVFSMSVISLIKQIKNGFELKHEYIYIGIGSAIGGIIGKEIFFRMVGEINPDNITAVQSAMLVVLLVVVLFKDKIKKVVLEGKYTMLLLGCLLGCVSSFLGIGGGPINVFVVVAFLGMVTKDAAIVSVLIIFCSQLTKITSICLTSDLSLYNLDMLPFIILKKGMFING